MQNTTGTAFPLEVSGILLKNQSAVICDQILRDLFVSPYDAGQGWVGVNCKDEGKHCKAIKVFRKQCYFQQRKSSAEVFSKNSRHLPVSGMTIQMTLKMNAVK